jgi:hypothetical protein
LSVGCTSAELFCDKPWRGVFMLLAEPLIFCGCYILLQ